MQCLGISGSIYDDNLYTPIHAASSYSQVEILKYLIEKGQGNINIIDFEGETALFYAETITIIQLILTLGGNPLHENHLGQTVNILSLSSRSSASASVYTDYVAMTTNYDYTTGSTNVTIRLSSFIIIFIFYYRSTFYTNYIIIYYYYHSLGG